MNYYNRYVTVFLVYALVAQPLHGMQEQPSDRTDVAALAAAALGVIGLGGLGWYLFKAKKLRDQQLQVQKTTNEQTLTALQKQTKLFLLAAAPITSEADKQELEQLLQDPAITVNVRDAVGKLPLIEAVRVQNQPMVIFLLNHGAKINGKDDKGNTALIAAVATKNDALARLLVDRVASIKPKNKAGASAISLAFAHNNQDLLKVLQNKQKEYAKEFFDAVHAGNLHEVEKLLAYVDSNTKNERGETALFEAVRHNHAALVKFLIAQGAQANILNARDESILIPAITASSFSLAPQDKQPYMLSVVLALPTVEALINTKNKEGNTPLLFAMTRRNPTAVAELLRAGANPFTVNDAGATAFDIAETLGTSPEAGHIMDLLRPYLLRRRSKENGVPLRKGTPSPKIKRA